MKINRFKILKNLSLFKHGRNTLLFMLAVFSAFCSELAFSSSATSQTLTASQLGQIINKTEKSWEEGYEEYFDRDFDNYSRTETEIAEKLSQLSEKTETRPAVMWAVPAQDRLYLLLITPGKEPIIKSVRGADRQTLFKTIDLFYKTIYSSLESDSTAYLPPAQQLHQWLIAPLEPTLQAENIDTLILCSGPSLRSFPFAALHDGERFLVEKYATARIPAFNLTNITHDDTDISNIQVLAMGASEFANQPPLPGVEVELSTITPRTLSGVAKLDQEFTVENLKSEHQRGFEVIHLATHAEFNPGSSSDSYIQFSDTQLSLDRIDELGLDSPPVDLLVLSACETAVGDREAEFGFAGLALQAGVESALASLWAIDDAGTVALMSEFYQNLKSPLMKAEALRQAQMAMIQKQVYVKGNRLRNSRGAVSLPPKLARSERQNLSHPFYWAGFSLIGNPF